MYRGGERKREWSNRVAKGWVLEFILLFILWLPREGKKERKRNKPKTKSQREKEREQKKPETLWIDRYSRLKFSSFSRLLCVFACVLFTQLIFFYTLLLMDPFIVVSSIIELRKGIKIETFATIRSYWFLFVFLSIYCIFCGLKAFCFGTDLLRSLQFQWSNECKFKSILCS